MEQGKANYKFAAALSYISTLLSVLVGIFFTPFLINKLGQQEYGLYQLIGSFAGYLSIFDFGLGTAITRYVAQYKVQRQYRAMSNFLAICARVYLLVGLAVLSICTILYFNIQFIFGKSLGSSQISEAKTLFVLFSINIAASLIFQYFPAIIYGYKQFAFDRLLTILRTVIRCVAIIILLVAGFGAVSIVVVDTILNIVFTIIRFLYCKFRLKVRFRYEYFDKKLVLEIISFSVAVFAVSIISILNSSTNQFVLGIVNGTVQVSICAVGMTVLQLYQQFAQAIINMVLPKVSEMDAMKSQPKDYTPIFIKTGRVQLPVLAAIAVGFTCFGKQFILLWVGAEYADSYWVALVIMWSYLIPYVGGAISQVITARKQLKGLIIIYAASAIVNLILSIMLAARYGAIGAAVGTAIVTILGNTIGFYLYDAKVLKFEIGVFLKTTFHRYWVAIPMMLLIGWFVSGLGNGGWLNLIGKIALFLVLYVLCVWLIALNANEKRKIISQMKAVKKRI